MTKAHEPMITGLIHLADGLTKIIIQQQNILNSKLEQIMTTQTEAKAVIDDMVAKQTALGAALSEASTELNEKIAALQATIDQLTASAANGPNILITPELQASIDAAVSQMSALSAQGQALADIVPNPVTPAA